MNPLESAKLSLTAIKANKLRSGLTMLGIIIGVAAIIMLVSIGAGLSEYVSKQFEGFGTNQVIVIPGKFEYSGGGPPRSVNKLSFAVVESLQNSIGGVITDVSPYIEIAVTVSYRNKSLVTTLAGAESNYFSLFDFKPEKGRLFNELDDRRARKVAVIGKTVAEELYPGQNPIGKKIDLSDSSFTVIGVLESEGSVAGADVDNQVAIPISAARTLTEADQVNSIFVKTASPEVVPQAKKRVETILKRSLSEDDFSVLTQEQLLSSILQILGVLTAMLGGIAAISLIVGGVGISNIMLVSVTERTKEIGLRKAVGAKPKDILMQFLLEAVILSLLGGAIGVFIGYLGSLAISAFLQTAVPLWAVVLGVGFSSLVGIVFGVAPAIRASRLQPIDALRHE